MRLGLLIPALLLVGTVSLPAQTDSIGSWVRQHAVNLSVTEEAFASLDALVAPARLIGVGESVHGVQEFQEFRGALLKDLIRRHSVTALLLESGMAEALAVDDYVQGRTDSLPWFSALSHDYASSTTVRATIAWIREWNRGPGRAHPVRIHGVDLAIGASTMLPPLDRLRELIADEPMLVAMVDSLRPMAQRLAAPWWRPAAQKYDSLSPQQRTQLTTGVERLLAAVRQWNRGSAEQRAWAERFATVVQQYEVQQRLGVNDPRLPRDEAMAANTRWFLDRMPPGERAVLWAHNAHIQRVPIRGPMMPPGVTSFPGTGFHFANDPAVRYLAIGTSYGGASMDSSAAPAAGSVDAALANAQRPRFLLRLGQASTDGLASAWLHADRPMRFQTGHLSVALGKAFDVVVFFEKATRATSGQ